MAECFRVLEPGGRFVFTSHDRSIPKWKKFWVNEQKKWRIGIQAKELLEFGDRYGETPTGKLFIHVPEANEVRKDLQQIGFSWKGMFYVQNFLMNHKLFVISQTNVVFG